MIVVAMISYFFIRNAMLYDGDFLGMRSLTEASEMYAREDIKPSNRSTPMNLGMGLGEMLNTTQYMGKTWANATFQSFVAVFGYMDVYAPDWVYNVYKIVLLLGVIGIIIRLVQRLKNDRTKQIKEQVIFHVNMLICMVIPVGLKYILQLRNRLSATGTLLLSDAAGIDIFCCKGDGVFGEAASFGKSADDVVPYNECIIWSHNGVCIFVHVYVLAIINRKRCLIK